MAQIANEINWLRTKVDANPASIFFARLADQYLALDEIDQAINIAERGLVNNPHYATAHYILAKCYVKRQEFDRASKYLKDALTSDPDYLAALSLYSELLSKIGSTNEARKNYNRILQIDPGDRKIMDLLAKLGAEPQEETGPLVQAEPEEQLDSESEFELSETESVNWPETDFSFLSDDDDTFKDDTLSQTEETPFNQNPFDEFDNEFEQNQDPFDLQTETDSESFTEPEIESEPIESEESPVSSEFDELEFSKKYKEEGAEFTRILDNIFSDSLNEEERKEENTRNTIENIAKSADEIKDESSEDRTALNDNLQTDEDQDIFADSDETFEPLMPLEDGISPEEQILSTAPMDDEFRGPVSPPVFPEDEEDELMPDEFISFENEQAESPGQVEETTDDFGFTADLPADDQNDDFNFTTDLPDDNLQQDSDTESFSELSESESFIFEQEPTESAQQQSGDFEELFPDESGDDFDEFDQLFEEPGAQDFQDEQQETKAAVDDEEYRRFISSLDIQEDESMNPESSPLDESHRPAADQTEQELDDLFEGLDDFNDLTVDENSWELSDSQENVLDQPVNKETFEQPSSDLDDDSIFADLDEEQDAELDWDMLDSNDEDEPTPASENDEPLQEPIADLNFDAKPKDKFVTPTLGEIYAAQGQYSKAISVFETLLKKNPDDEWYKKKLDYLHQKLNEQNS